MSEQKTMQQADLPTLESAPGEKHSAVIARGISMPAHQVRIAIEQAVARGQVSEEDGEEVWWLYNYAQENHLKEADLAAKMKAYDKNTLYQLFRGSYGVSGGGKFASWNNVIKTIREFKKIEIEEMKKKNVGIIETEVKQTVWRCCDAALNDGMVSFIYGRTRIGKSVALQAYQREHNHGQTIYIEMGSGWTRTRFVRELARKFGNGVKATKSWALEDAIFDTLKRSNLLIVDEFHKALTTTGERQSATVLEFIRDIRDKTRCGLVLCATKVGMERFETGANKQTFEQLIGRSIIKAVLPDRPEGLLQSEHAGVEPEALFNIAHADRRVAQSRDCRDPLTVHGLSSFVILPAGCFTLFTERPACLRHDTVFRRPAGSAAYKPPSRPGCSAARSVSTPAAAPPARRRSAQARRRAGT